MKYLLMLIAIMGGMTLEILLIDWEFSTAFSSVLADVVGVILVVTSWNSIHYLNKKL